MDRRGGGEMLKDQKGRTRYVSPVAAVTAFICVHESLNVIYKTRSPSLVLWAAAVGRVKVEHEATEGRRISVYLCRFLGHPSYM